MSGSTIVQTVNVPADHRLIIEVPPEVPAGRTMLAFTPIPAKRRLSTMSTEEIAALEARDRELFELHAEELNAEALDVLSYQLLQTTPSVLPLLPDKPVALLIRLLPGFFGFFAIIFRQFRFFPHFFITV
jgi:hypothetical protein